MSPIRCIALALACGLVLAAAGCVSLKKPAVEKRYFTVEAQRPSQNRTGPVDGVLKVRRLRVSPSYSGKGLVYKVSKNAFESDFYNAYFTPPSDMLTQEVMDWLAKSGVFTHVVDPSSLIQSHLTLEGVVNAIYGDYAATPATAVLKMQFFLIDEANPDRAIVFAKDYNREEALYTDKPSELVQAQSENLASILEELEGDLREAVAKRE